MNWGWNVKQFLSDCAVEREPDNGIAHYKRQIGSAKNLLISGLTVIKKLSPPPQKDAEACGRFLANELDEIAYLVRIVLRSCSRDPKALDVEEVDDLAQRLRQAASDLNAYKEEIEDTEIITDEDQHPGCNNASTWL